MSEQRSIHSHGHAQSLAGTIGCNIEDVRTQERFASRQNDDRARKRRDFIQEFEALLGCELVFVGPVQCRGTAVNAGEVAGPSDLPGYEAQVGLLPPMAPRFWRIMSMIGMG